jgi:hypothetical protein
MFFGKKNKSKKIILFDFRSSSVAASIIGIEKENHLPKIFFTKRENYYFTEAPKADEFINRAHIALKKLIKNIHSFKIDDSNLDHVTSEIHVLYGAPWYNPDFIEAHYEQDKPFIFNKELLAKIIKSATKEIESNTEGEIIEKNIASILINGYETDSPFNKKATDVKMSLYLSHVANQTKEDIENIIKNNFHIDKIHSHSHASMFYTFLRNNFHSANNYVLLDISGEVTEVTIVRNSFFKKNITVPVGSHIFNRKLSEIYGYDLYTAISNINVFLDNKNEPKSKKRAKEMFENIKDHYLELIKSSFSREKVLNIPTKIFIIADEEVRNLFINIFESSDGYGGTLKMSKKPNIISFNKDTFKNLCSYSTGVNADNTISIFSNFVKMYSNTD